MRAFKGFKVWAAVLLLAVALWAQSGQILNMGDLKAQIDAFNAGNSDITITIGADFDVSSPLEINNDGYTLTMQSLTSTPRQLTRAAMGNLFTIKNSSLTLQNITIDGNKTNATYVNARGSLIYVDEGGVLNMLGGTTLQNNASDDNGSGVYVYSRGKFNMSDGIITGNKTNLSGGGVYIYALRATFNMSGGIVTNDTCGTSATSYSGGVHFANTPFATDTIADKTPSVFRLGGTAVIKDNAKGNGNLSNVYMAGNRYITLGDGTDGVPAPTDGMEVWITKVAEHGLFVNKGAKPPNPPDDPFGDTKYFQADAGSQIYYIETGKLAMEAGYDISLNPDNLKFMKIHGYDDVQPYQIKVTNIGGKIGKLMIRLAGEYANNFVLDTTDISNDGMEQSATQTFTVKPITGLDPGTYDAFVVVSAPESTDGGSVIMRRLDIEFLVREYVEDRTLYFNQSDGKFYASNAYTEIGSLPAPSIFVPDNEIRMPASWDSETNTLKLYDVDWNTTAPYSLYFSQPTPLTLELVGDNSFVSTSDTTNSAGIVSRSCLAIIGDSLKAQGGTYGLFSQALTINSGTFTALGGTTAMQIGEVILRTPPERYDWWYTDDATKGSGEFAYDPAYKWIKIKVPPPDYEIAVSADNNEPFVNTNVEITLTVKDITTGKINESIDGLHDVVLTGVPPETFGVTDTNSVQFDKGVGKLNLRPENLGAQILHFSMEHPEYPAINPIAITPILQNLLPPEVPPVVPPVEPPVVPPVDPPVYPPVDPPVEPPVDPPVEPPVDPPVVPPVEPPVVPPVVPPEAPPDISLHPDTLTFPSAIYGYFAQASLNFIIENRNSNGYPTGELTVKLSGNDSTSFAISSNKVTTIAADGSVALKIAPISGLGAKKYTATIIVSGNRIAKSKELVVNFTVEKAPGTKVATPKLANELSNSVFIYSVAKPSNGQEVEYAISETKNSPKDSAFVTFGSTLNILEFSGLKNTTYYIFARSKENANYKAGNISEPLESCVPFNEIAVALWGNNTLTVINNPKNNVMGSAFYNFVWFRDGLEIGWGQSLSENKNGKSLQSGKYHVEMTSGDGKLISCKYEILEPPPIAETTSTGFSDIEATEVYSVSGKRLTRLNAKDLILKSKTGSKKTIKVGEMSR